MFETIEVQRHLDFLRRVAMFALSVVMHALGMFVLLIVPLVFFNVLGEGELLTFLIAPPQPPAAPPPPAPPPQGETAGQTVRPIIIHGGFREPSRIPDTISMAPDEPVSLSQTAGLWPEGLSGTQPGVGGGIVGDSLRALALPPPPSLPPPPKPVRMTALPIGGNVLESRLIHRVEPIYPELAKRARVAGVVVLEVNVSDEGDVAEIRVLQGHPLLNEAAVEAVRQWKYSPTLLNGEPVPVLATVTVRFNLR